MEHNNRIEKFYDFIGRSDFPCIIAKNIANKRAIDVMAAGDICCPAYDGAILDFIYSFVGKFRKETVPFQSAAVIFTDMQRLSEDDFEFHMWNRLNALRKKDAEHHGYDTRVSDDPFSPEFSFSLMEEAFFVLALHPQSSRLARRFEYPVLVFNPHSQFEVMKQTNVYEKTKSIVRRRDIMLSGSVNPMLTDFGNSSEASQYSGKFYDSQWRCPLISNIKP